jgi:DNA-binding transcriptional regulator GbsR (MarR family)
MSEAAPVTQAPTPVAGLRSGGDPGDVAASVDAATRRVAETIAELMAFWNFKPSMGKVWTVLYLSQDPLSADEIVERSGLSAGSVSMTVHELLEWGVVRRAWRPGSRKRHYVAETDILAMVTRVFRQRELALITRSVEELEEAVKVLVELSPDVSAGQRQRGRFVLGRIQKLLALARAGRIVVERFSKGGLLDLRGLRDALGGAH